MKPVNINLTSEGSISNHASLKNLKSARVKYHSKEDIELSKSKVKSLINFVHDNQQYGSGQHSDRAYRRKRNRPSSKASTRVIMVSDLT